MQILRPKKVWSRSHGKKKVGLVVGGKNYLDTHEQLPTKAFQVKNLVKQATCIAIYVIACNC